MTYVYPDDQPSGLNAPPRLLMFAVLTIFALIVAAGVGVVMYVTGGRRLGALIPFGIGTAIALPIFTLLLALLFRRGLPRWFVPVLLGFWLFVGVIAGLGSVFAYRSLLPPRYQEEVLTYVPFMRGLLPPTPVGGTIPTVAVTAGGISPEDLLSMPLLTGGTQTLDPAAAAATEEATQAPTSEPPTATPTVPPSTATPSPTPEPTEVSVLPTPTIPQPTPEPISNVSSAPDRPVAARMYGFRHEIQEWNNCGPTNVTMALSFFGWQEDQRYAARFLRPDPEDKNVSPYELVNFVNEQSQVRALYRIGGDMDLIKRLIANNFPVIIETAYAFEGYDWIGHYQTVVGYDDLAGSFYVYDSYIGTGADGNGIPEDYDTFDANWQAFNRVFIVLYRPQDEAAVAGILGDRADVQSAAEIAAATAQSEAQANPQNMFAWFNLGSSFVALGQYEQAAAAYDRARQFGLPFRINWYQFGMFEAYFSVGRYDDVLSFVQTNLTNGARYVEETFYWQGQVLAARGDSAGARSAYQQALALNPSFEAANTALNALSA